MKVNRQIAQATESAVYIVANCTVIHIVLHTARKKQVRCKRSQICHVPKWCYHVIL